MARRTLSPSLVFRVRGRVRVLGSGFCVRIRVSVTGNVSPKHNAPSLHQPYTHALLL